MGTFELVPPAKDARMLEPPPEAELGSALLLQNARWFIRVRWSIAGVLAATGLVAALFPSWPGSLGITVASVWLWALASCLAAANVVFHLVLLHFPQKDPRSSAVAFLRWQIAVDLVVVTLLVHVIGSTRTFIPFIYLFHIAMACIFFPRKESFIVALGSGILYLLAVLGEVAGAWPSMGIYAEGSVTRSSLALLVAASAVFIWWVVWYFVSTLSDAVRRRDIQLSAANEQLLRIDQEKNRQMLTTVHELKSPFASIEGSIEVLKVQHGELMTPPVGAILERIDLQARLLSERISEVLFLGNLRSVDASTKALDPVDISGLMENVRASIEQKARSRRVRIEQRLPPIVVPGNAEQLAVLFTNLLSNAVSYSNEGGLVEISASQEKDGLHVRVADHGIGIREDALPRIFEEFFRTKEGARFNRMSTGLGLAIVKEIARQFGLRITVTSELDKGTSFDVAFPKPTETG